MSRKITSQTQFELLVSFMETNGDLNKPASGPHGKMRNATLWTQLTNLLNSNGSGEKKTEDKWRKVWSDLKNNTKRKAAKIHKEANRTGGGPAHPASLSEVEERVLSIINVRSATGLDNPEIGFELDLAEEQPRGSGMQVEATQSDIALDTEQTQQPAFDIEESQEILVPLDYIQETEAEDFQQEEPTSMQQERPVVQPAAYDMADRVAHPGTWRNDPAPGPSRVTPRVERRRRAGNVFPPGQLRDRFRRHSSQADRAAEHFLHSDNEWRKYLKERDGRAEERENRWLTILERMTTVMEKIVEKF